MLKVLPDLTFPVTAKQADPLMDNLVQLNIIDAGLSEKTQRALALFFHTWDIWIKTGGKVDYRGPDGHTRMLQDGMAFVGSGNPVATRHGDLAAAHLAIDWHDTQMRLKKAGMPLLVGDVASLFDQCRDLAEYAIEIDKRVGLLMDYVGKRRLL